MEYRIALADLDRGVEASETAIVARHPSETQERLVLRVLTWCLLWEPRLAFGPGLCDPEAPDLVARDLTGRVTKWVECGSASPEKLRKAVQHNAGAEVHAVFGDARRRDELRDALAGWKRADDVSLWLLDGKLVSGLAARDQHRHKWTVTIVGDHLYVDDGESARDGAIERSGRRK